MIPEASESKIEFSRSFREVGVRLINTGKRYNREWIFRHCNYNFISGKKYAITGPNGSGKSTLLQVIAGAIQHNEGTIEYINDPGYGIRPAPMTAGSSGDTGSSNHLQISIAAPYLELIEEMTATEVLSFHTQFKKLIAPVPVILQAVGLEKAANKQLRYFSSGMKQRLKLAQAFFSDTPVLLLDEPTTNLDADGIGLYHDLIADHTNGKLVLISSNDPQEYNFCDEVISISDYKKA